MNAATAWAVEKSVAVGAERAVLVAIARRAEGCIAVCDPRDIMKEVGLRGRAYYECLIPLEQLREIERLLDRHDKARLRAFHFPKFCESSHAACDLAKKNSAVAVDCGNQLAPLLSILQEQCGDLKTKNGQVRGGNLSVQKSPVQQRLFPDILPADEAKELCEDCRGTGWRTTQAGAVLCRHAAARIAGRWKMAEYKQQDLLAYLEVHRAVYALRASEQFRLIA